ncbi:fructose-6-phosphate aldolase [Proteiniclasticum sp. QWL-01]|uniref:fructose-6-phosphate aldolase n=1 Tax=Proteiniclasticum sp. QWL-01 TaxID=3036945 RepID=UPI0022017BB4|nr:fructose-6-phosphate aldolase [Proteiniclasticum sp. QWL-01]UUM13254.1 fructose-6-phosphate aldolase [Clostridiaceae bacterium HFYG-1003]WFF71676.1 fructose-6-phosphate aldolase [Proteiniclasticum sp. QWL-01]
MKYFIDTANVEEIRKAAELGLLSGVTTNPSLIAKEGRKFEDVIKEITELVDGPISAEVVSLEADGMLKEGRELVKIHPNIVIKVPMTAEGLKATHQFKKENIKVNVTLVFSAEQALAAARAGAAYVSPFIGRVDDMGIDGVLLIEEIATIFNMFDIDTEIIAASIRNRRHIAQAALAGADISTVPYKVLMESLNHPLTTSGIERFLKDWEGVKNL